jgi:uracil-DNA glycosylase family 4
VERTRSEALRRLQDEVVACRACPRLVAWREQVGVEKRASFRDDDYWARPVPAFGDPEARVVIVGLAPAAHGANRTGRMFTGDRSGDFLYASLHRTGFANQPTSTDRDDGLQLRGAWITAPVRCAPPANQPTPAERDACRPFLERELALLDARVLVPLGGFAYEGLCRIFGVARRPKFAHGVEVEVGNGRWIVGSYHVSQQNTFTGKLTEPMLDAVFTRARQLAWP